MNHHNEIVCPKCGNTYCLRCESATCPDCGHVYKLKWQKPELVTIPESKFDDSYRYDFLTKLLRMFAKEDGFKYRINRTDSLIEIIMKLEGKSTYSSLDLSDPEDVKAADMTRIINQIIFFAV